MKSRIFIALLPFCFCSSFALAEIRHHEAHTHGIADLNIAIDDDSVFIELESPAINLLGFEHKPQNDAQQKALTATLEVLNDIRQVIRFDQADCRATETVIRPPFDADQSIQDNSDSNASEEHSEFHARYTLTCDNADHIRTGTVHLFDRFAGFETVRVRWITSNGQGTARLNSRSKTFTID